MHWVNPVTGLNLTSIFITNFFGVILMIALLFSRGWIVRVKKHEGNLVLLMILSVLAGCFIEPLSFVCEGLPGNGIHYCLFFLNTILFSLDVIIGPCYAAILTSHINKKLSRIQIYVILTLIVIEMIMLVINFFNPIIFYRSGTYGLWSLCFPSRKIKRKNIKIFPCMAVPGSYSFRNFNTGIYLRRIGYLAEHRHSDMQYRFMSSERKHFHRQTDRRL